VGEREVGVHGWPTGPLTGPRWWGNRGGHTVGREPRPRPWELGPRPREEGRDRRAAGLREKKEQAFKSNFQGEVRVSFSFSLFFFFSFLYFKSNSKTI